MKNMKYIYLSIIGLLFLVLIPFSVQAKDIEVTNVEVLEKNHYVSEVSSPSINEDKIDFNLKFEDYEQYITYKITVNNNSYYDYTYEINKNDESIISYEILDEENKINYSSTKDIVLKVWYKEEINEELYNDNKYNIEDKIELKFSGPEITSVDTIEELKKAIENPETGAFFSIIIALVVLIISIIVYKKAKSLSKFKHFIWLILLVPVIVLASSNTISIYLNFKIEIIKPTIAIFNTGNTINNIIKSYSYNTQYFKRSNSKADNAIEVQASDSLEKIYMYYNNDSNTVYFYSDAIRIYYNIDSSNFYSGLDKLLDFDKDIKPDLIKNASYMFNWTLHYVDDYALDLTNWNTSNMVNIAHMFHGVGYYAKNLKINISNWDTSNVEYADGLFDSFGYNATESVEINANNIDLSKASRSSIMSTAAYYVPNVKITLDDVKLPSSQSYYPLIYAVGENAKNVYFSGKNWNVSNFSERFLSYVGGYAEKLDMDLSGWKIGPNTFLEELFINNSLSAVNINLNLSNWDLSERTSLASLFYAIGLNAKNYKLDLTGWDTSNITDMSKMFYRAFEGEVQKESINVIGLEDFNTSNVTNMQSMFYMSFKNTNNIDLDLSNWNVSKVTNMNQIFFTMFQYGNNNSLNISNWDTKIVNNVDLAFAYFGQFGQNNSHIGDNSWNLTNCSDTTKMYGY